MAQASWSAPTRMVFLLHGEDPFRTRLRVGELVESLLAGGAGEPGDLSARPSPRLGGALGLTRIDARSDPNRKLLCIPTGHEYLLHATVLRSAARARSRRISRSGKG